MNVRFKFTVSERFSDKNHIYATNKNARIRAQSKKTFVPSIRSDSLVLDKEKQ